VADLQTHLTCNVEQYSQRIKMRDDVDAAREVEHFANFRAIKDARAAGAALEKLGYGVTVTRRFIARGTLRATKQATVDVESADQMVEEVFAVVAAHHGDYDGWAAPLVQS
jgi:regulator of RNase E activity RraB